ncbi:MAG: hypothetical protein DMG11_08820 [Acidobacteria bacterium]|nr:MAG: hypothetical protein DMG11_08820 [Acidobacteriota bacterium]
MKSFNFVFVLLLVLVTSATAHAAMQSQATTGTIEGTVTDQTGAVLPGVAVSLKSVETGIVRMVLSDDRGIFRAPLLPVGHYDVSVEFTGFTKFEQTAIALTVGQTLQLNIRLSVAGTTQAVSVTEEVPVVEATRTQVSSTVDDRAVANLPVNGRNFIDFVLLTPGVTRDVRAGDISFAGQRGTMNSLVIDGADNNNTFFGQATGRTGSGRAPFQFSQDAVKEFQVNSNGYSAEFGRAGGAVINVVTKSGTNDLHGTGFWFYRDKSLNANDVINKVAVPPRGRSPYHFNQFGASAGGPIVKDKAFFFVNYDGQRNTVQNIVFLNLPATTPSDAATQTAIQRLSPLANSWNRTQNQDTFLGKGDWQFSTNHHVSLRYNHQNYTGGGGEAGGPQNAFEHTGDSLVKTDTLNGSVSSILTNRLFNEFRAQYARDKEPGAANSANPEATILEGGQTVMTIGRNFFSPRETTIKRGQFADNLSLIAGRHNFKFGGDLNADRILNFFPGNFSGSYRFNTLAGFTSGRPTAAGERYVQAFAGEGTTGATTRPNMTEFAGFFQDDWRVSNRLTLNLGARYDVQRVAQPTTKNPSPQLAAAGIDTNRIPIDKNNFAPRVGLAWRPVSNSDRFVVRAGYGIFFARTPSIMVGTAHSNNGLNVQTITFTGTAVPTYPNKFDSLPAGATAPLPTIFVFDKNYVSPYTQQGNLAVEYGLSNDVSVTVTYLGVRGVHLQRSHDLNVGIPTDTPITVAGEGRTLVYKRFPTARPFTAFDRLIAFESTANAIYHGMTIQVNKRYSRNIQLSGAYTWSKVLDDVPDATAVVPQGSDDAKYVQNPLNVRDDRAVGGNDQPHRVVINGIWDLRYAEGVSNRVAKGILGGWQIAGIFTAQSGQPYTGLISADLNNDGNNRSDRAPDLGRNTFRAPKTVNFDPRVTREVSVIERVRLQFIFEAFNVFNRYNVTATPATSPNAVRNTLYALTGGQLVRQSNFGQILGTSNPRVIQFATKILF